MGVHGYQEVGLVRMYRSKVWLVDVVVRIEYTPVYNYIDFLIILIPTNSTCISSFLAAAYLLVCSF